MKRNIMMALFGVLMATVSAQVTTTWRIEAGYVQPYQFGNGYRTTYFHGGKLGALVDVNFKFYKLPLGAGGDHGMENTVIVDPLFQGGIIYLKALKTVRSRFIAKRLKRGSFHILS